MLEVDEMARFEFKLDAQRIKKKQEEEKILKEKWAQYYAKDKINRKYQVETQNPIGTNAKLLSTKTYRSKIAIKT